VPPVDLTFPGIRAIHADARTDKPIVVETGHLVSLCFDARGIQSTMLRAAPDALAREYTRTMMGFLLSRQETARIGMVGLGGGSLVTYCHRYLPEAYITAVEINPDGIALRDRFHIPPDDERLTVVCADAAHDLSTTAQTFDVLLLDGVNANGAPAGLCSAAFYEACRARLGDDGVLVANLLGDEPHPRDGLARYSAPPSRSLRLKTVRAT
jgi:spermidine synthase